MKLYLEIDGERYANIEIDARLLSVAPDRAKFIAAEIEPYVTAMLELKSEPEKGQS